MFIGMLSMGNSGKILFYPENWSSEVKADKKKIIELGEKGELDL